MERFQLLTHLADLFESALFCGGLCCKAGVDTLDTSLDGCPGFGLSLNHPDEISTKLYVPTEVTHPLACSLRPAKWRMMTNVSQFIFIPVKSHLS